MPKLGLTSTLSTSGLATPGIVTDNLVLKHKYDAGAVVPVSDGAAFFNSSNTDWITITETTLDVDGGNITFAFWLKRTVVSAVNTVFGHSVESNERHIRFVADGTLKIESDEDGDEAVITLNNANDYLWHHYAIVCQSGTVTAFQDGVSCSISGDVDDDNIILNRIGQGASYPIDGYLCNIGIWTGALTQAQIKSIMWKNYAGLTDSDKDAGATGSSNLVSWYNLDSKTEFDSAGTDDGLVIDNNDTTVGSELLTGFTNGGEYPFNIFSTSGQNISAAVESTGNWGGCASNVLNITAGKWYKCTFNLTYTSGTDDIRMALVNGPGGASSQQSNDTYTSTNGINTMYFKATATDASAYLQIGTGEATDVINFSMRNISLKKMSSSNHGVLT